MAAAERRDGECTSSTTVARSPLAEFARNGCAGAAAGGTNSSTTHSIKHRPSRMCHLVLHTYSYIPRLESSQQLRSKSSRGSSSASHDFCFAHFPRYRPRPFFAGRHQRGGAQTFMKVVGVAMLFLARSPLPLAQFCLWSRHAHVELIARF